VALRLSFVLHRGIALLLVLLASLVGGCGQPEPTPNPPRDPQTVILRMREMASLAPAQDLWALPGFSLYGDGRVMIPDGYDGAMPLAREHRVTEATIDRLFRDAAGAGLLHDNFYRLHVLDGSTLTISIRSDLVEYVTTVHAPEANQDGARGRVVAFRRDLDVSRWPADRFSAPPIAYQPERLAVLVYAGSTAQTTDVRPWPLETPVSAMPGAPTHPCVVLDGASARRVATIARAARPETRWRSEEQELSIVFRPMLPDERDCADLDRR